MNYDVKIQPADVSYIASKEDTILDAALTNKLFLEHSCKKGECGLCTVTLLSGSVKSKQGCITSQGEILTCSSYPASNLSIRANFYLELAEIQCVTLPCKIVNQVFFAPDIVILTLRYPPTTKFNYLPGQYIDLIYKGVRRSYSIANTQTVLAGIELHIRLIPNGEFSQLLRHESGIGQMVRIEGPKGTFFVRKSSSPIIFLAGGTGFAPIKAMIEFLLENNIDRNINIYWGMTGAEDFYSNLPYSWAEKYNNIRYVPVVSSEDEAWSGRRGLVSQAVINDFPNLSAYHVYACGSPLMINSAKEMFVSCGLSPLHFYADVFVSSK